MYGYEDPAVPDYKAWLIQKILSGAQDYTYGPGSPSPTPSDMRQLIGSRDNRLATGDVALPLRDYRLFSPAERAQYRIADTSWFTPGRPTPPGSVERYYGAGAPMAYAANRPLTAGDLGIPFTPAGGKASAPGAGAVGPTPVAEFVREMEARMRTPAAPGAAGGVAGAIGGPAGMGVGADTAVARPMQSSWGDYGEAVAGAEKAGAIGKSIAGGIQGMGQGLQKQAQAGFQAAQERIRQGNIFRQFLATLLQPGGFGEV